MRISTAFAAATLLLTTAAASAAHPDREAELSKALEGRVAGKPVNCLMLRDIRSTRIISNTAILYETSNRTVYLNRPRSGANFLDRDDILVTDTHGDQLCSIDIVRLIDQGSHTPSGSVGLDTFVPYTKPAKR